MFFGFFVCFECTQLSFIEIIQLKQFIMFNWALGEFFVCRWLGILIENTGFWGVLEGNFKLKLKILVRISILRPSMRGNAWFTLRKMFCDAFFMFQGKWVLRKLACSVFTAKLHNKGMFKARLTFDMIHSSIWLH